MSNIDALKIAVLAAFRKLPIAQKFMLAVICLILVIMIAVNSLVLTAQKSALRDEIENGHLLVVRNLGKDVVEPLMFLDPLRLDQHLQVTIQTPGCVYAMVLDRAGRVVAHSDRRQLGLHPFGSAERSGGMFSEHVLERPGESADPLIREIWVPVRIGNEGIGAAIGGFSASRIDTLVDENLSQMKRALIGITTVMLAIGVTGSFLLARVLTTPMKRLRERMGRVQSGDLQPEAVKTPSGRCWEIMECAMQTCPAFGKDSRCWTTPRECGECFFSSGGRDRHTCRTCPVYRETAGDEIGELEQSFEEMVDRLRRSLDELEQSTREKTRLEKMSALGEMSMTVAHEIKNPLNAIRGAVSYLQDNFKGEVLREFLGIIEAETNRLNEIVTNYLVFSRPTPLRKEEADLNKAVTDVVSLMRQEALEENKEIAVQTDETIGRFSFDVHQMKQALLNLLVNALDATHEGDTITIRTVARDGSVDVIIKDTGSGIPSDVLPEIFRPFYTTKTRGSGLGLPCVERIIRDHGGDIAVVSMPASGTEFRITIPTGEQGERSDRNYPSC